MLNYDFQLELRLKKLDRDLAKRYADCMVLFEQMLKKLLAAFPNFTDHTLLHTLNITNISNQLLRGEVEKLNADEIYIYLMALALHDIGMGISGRDLESFVDELGLREYINAHPEQPKSAFVRTFHHDFSAAFVRKYWQIFEIPDERYAHAIAETARGHRRTDLMDEKQYPVDYDLGDGKQVNLALLAALIRIADELDVAADRNPELLYNEERLACMSELAMFEFDKHKATRSVEFTRDAVVISACAEEAALAEGIFNTVRKAGKTFEYCVAVMAARSTVRIDCERVVYLLNGQEVSIK